MKKWIKITGLALLGLLLIFSIVAGTFIYRVTYGLPFFDSTPPELPADMEDFAVLVFSKTNGFRHGEAIAAAQPAFNQMADQNKWTVFFTDNGAVFNPDQLARFDVVVWNNSTGRVLRDEQRKSFRQYIESGGGFVGIHGAGDGSHHWDWYEDQLIAAHFSHHSISPQFQEAVMHRECPQGYAACGSYPGEWTRTDEWYVFFDNPRKNGARVLYTVDENTFETSGNISYLVSDKDFGMGEDHPIVWYNCVGKGKAFYSALGHAGAAFSESTYLQILEDAIRWAGNEENPCL